MLYQKYVSSQLVVSSPKAMRRFCEEARVHDFSLERDPLATAYCVAYTCSRTGDCSPMERLATFVAQYQIHNPLAGNWWLEFCLDYVMVSARLESPSALEGYLDVPGRAGAFASTRIASLSYYLGEAGILSLCAERAALENNPDYDWEAANCRALYSLLNGRQPDFAELCSCLRETTGGVRAFCSVDLYLLLLEMNPGISREYLDF